VRLVGGTIIPSVYPQFITADNGEEEREDDDDDIPQPDAFQHWVCCDSCAGWRIVQKAVPEGTEWVCSDNDRSCSEPEDVADGVYCKSSRSSSIDEEDEEEDEEDEDEEEVEADDSDFHKSPALTDLSSTFGNGSLHKKSAGPRPSLKSDASPAETVDAHVRNVSNDGCVVLLMGVSGAGKSTNARGLLGLPESNYVLAGKQSSVETIQLLRDGKSVVFDATHTTKKQRARALADALAADVPLVAILFDISNEKTMARLAERNRRGAELAAGPDFVPPLLDPFFADEKDHWMFPEGSEHGRKTQLKKWEAVVTDEAEQIERVLVISEDADGATRVQEAVAGGIIAPRGSYIGRGINAMHSMVGNKPNGPVHLPPCDGVIKLSDSSSDDESSRRVERALGFRTRYASPRAAQSLANTLSQIPGLLTVGGKRIISNTGLLDRLKGHGKGKLYAVLKKLKVAGLINNNYPHPDTACSKHRDKLGSTT